LDCLSEVASADLPPSNQVFGGDQESAIGSGSATCAARQAIDLFGHPGEYGAEDAMCTPVDFRWQP
jgi:hypothetical protein